MSQASVPNDSPLPAWYPDWARGLAELYFSGTTCLFTLHGNVHDLMRCPSQDADGYVNLPEFLATQVFGSWDIVLQYDLGRGLRALAGNDSTRLKSMVQYLTARMGEPASWPREAENVLLVLDKLIERNLLEDPERRKSIAVVLEYAQYLAPAGDLGGLVRGQATNLVRLLGWAQNPYIKQGNVAFCLVADKLTEVNDRLVQSPHVATIEIPMPDKAARESFAAWLCSSADLAATIGLEPAALGELSNGLSLVDLNVLLSQGKRSERRVDATRFRELKKAMIERQCQGLVEFVEPRHTLDLVVGQESAKQRLKEDAEMIAGGRPGSAPMGYLLCGPVGTGKTFLAECYAGSIGIPCLKLRNFRSKYVGETEGNLEQVLRVLRSLGPVVVIIDEADAALGNRSSDGDSGTSSRVFSMIASQMGDTNYRGKIVWMLLTCRPDLLPIDLKRQGRAEVHIPMFYPSSDAELQSMFLTMGRKNKVAITAEMLPAVKADRHLSGADIESVVLAARRRTERAGRAEMQKDDIEQALAEFIPSAEGLEKELQELAAVLECTELSFLPPDWRDKVAKPGGRAQLQERLVAIRQLMDGLKPQGAFNKEITMAKKKQKPGKPAPKGKKPAAPARSSAKPAARKISPKPAAPVKGSAASRLDAKSHAPLIDQYARRLTSFMKAMADGKVDDSELDEQEARLVTLMKEIEPRLDANLHAKVTQLLCELTAYDIMQMLHAMEAQRPQTVFRG